MSQRRRPARGARPSSSGTPQRPSRRAGVKGRRWPGWGLWLVLGLSCPLAAAAVAAYGLWSWARTARSAPGYVGLELAAADSIDQISEQLEQNGLLDSAWKFVWYSRCFGAGLSFEPGSHWLSLGSSPRELAQLLARRQNRPAKPVTLPEGWDSFQIAERLANSGVCSVTAFLAAAHDPELARASLGQSSFEGYLYPETYDLRQNSDARQLVVKFAGQARGRFAPIFQEAQGLRQQRALSAHELVVLASIVQKEAASLEEMPVIASVFFNRLQDPLFRPLRMLQSDPSAGYGCKLLDAPPSCLGFNGRITPAMLRDPVNRYNTYKQPGLPPGPIGNPSVEALRAVLRAPATRYYFFVAGADGRHRFSESLQQHQRAIAQ